MKNLIFAIILFTIIITIPATEETELFSEGDFLDNRKDQMKKDVIDYEQNMVDLSGYGLKFLIATGIFLIGIAVIIWYVRKVLDNTPLGNGRSIMIAIVLDELLVIGISGNNMSLLTKITDKDTIEEVKDKAASRVSSFKELLLLSSLDTFDNDKNKK
jgi:hypothetical protein